MPNEGVREATALYVTYMPHYLDERGLPVVGGPVGRFAAYLGSIVAAASQHPEEAPVPTGLPCRRRPGRTPCPGPVWVLQRKDGIIEWWCQTCGDDGLIHGWENTPWDFAAHRPSPRPPGGLRAVVLSASEYAALRRSSPSFSREEQAVVLRAVLVGAEAVRLEATDEEWEALAEAVAAEAGRARQRRWRVLLESVLDKVKVALASPAPAPRGHSSPSPFRVLRGGKGPTR